MEIAKHEREKISIQISTEGIPNYVLGMLLIPSANADFSIEVDIDGDAYADAFGAQWSKGQIFTVLLSDPVLKQLRSHRKKRINKKWHKRYGLVIAFQESSIISSCTKCVIDNSALTDDGRRLLGLDGV